MTIPKIFETCRPRADVLKRAITEADFAADLAQVIIGVGNVEYLEPARFFANTYPTRGLKNLLANVCRRLVGAGGEVASIFRLDTAYGGGKTHGLIALCHAARGMQGVPGIAEFVDPSLLPQSHVRIAAFDGENADPANGRRNGKSQKKLHRRTRMAKTRTDRPSRPVTSQTQRRPYHSLPRAFSRRHWSGCGNRRGRRRWRASTF